MVTSGVGIRSWRWGVCSGRGQREAIMAKHLFTTLVEYGDDLKVASATRQRHIGLALTRLAVTKRWPKSRDEVYVGLLSSDADELGNLVR